MSQSSLDNLYISKAIQLAKKGLYTTQPNPRVGCVIVLNNDIIGEGYHQQAGEPHAEIHALNQAGDKAKGATAYVSLEPCSHQGKTPPCADALIAAGVSRVVCAMQDPNPLVAGKGLEKLEKAGISTRSGLMQSEAEAINPGFIKRMKTGLPFVRVKLAMSLDGRTAMASGESKWITGEYARADVQKLRARSSVVLTGSGTVLADDPSMNVRVTSAELNAHVDLHQPLRAIIDSQLSVPLESKIFKQSGQTLVFSTQVADHAITMPSRGGKVDLQAALKYLADEHQANEVHVEAGNELCGALLEQHLVDEIVVYIAPHIMGDSAKGLFHMPGLQKMSERIDLEIKEIRPIGKDWRITAVPQ
ncbi:MAG: bifunctional diaminohydroxyphosphoribosylaminopyrimidine deaminase/5-amino-6-(5-phosphoribosylamino)uracil reductase RibD [endosymbiont of Galathealinum brachiosum]|uniref:Riboflavin biosynthesis protein RibD n=1 Tax=endosymbiont of Galathealinum brachiosum TaxID=2200906 RepID=A0A370DGA5_9GAMM|nr:MAG: bifunctional diaminohydroxyphosphoribosylaminopyrimidine deaminase/5-amino-6-(5-phosphoribosylamino)uracil reductase RibD [endosymbiont of Galathealinum brachiosum]